MPTEFFIAENNLTTDPVMLITNRKYLAMRDIPANDRMRILNLLKVSDQAMRCIASMGQYGIHDMNDKLCRFIKCNFGELDHVDDITDDNALNFEYVNCGFKMNNRCPWGKSFCVIKTKPLHLSCK
jgi:hypothetical protein